METESFGGQKKNLTRFAKYVVAAVILFFILIYVSYVFLQWAVFQSMYQLKFGNFDWFNTIFYHGYSFIVPAIIALVVIYPYKNRSDLFAFFRTLSTASRRSRTFGGFDETENIGVVPKEVQTTSRTIWLIWQLIKFGIAYGIAYGAQGFIFYPNVTESLMLDFYGAGSWSLVPRIFTLPIAPASGQELISLIPTMQTQYYILVTAVGTVIVILGIRFFLRLLTNAFSRGGNKWIGDLLAFVFVILFGIWLGAPYWLMNVTTPFLYYVLLIFMAGTLFGIAYFRLSGKGLIPLTARRRAATKIIALVLGAILIINLGTLAYLGVNWNNNWLEYQWMPQYQKQIDVTRWVAGLDNVTTLPISQIPTGNISQILGLVRQWDQNSSLIRSQSQIGLNYLSIANSEIVYLNGQQYWIAPTTISYPVTSTDWISEHLIYTHTDRIIILNAHTGVYENNLTKVLGIPANPALDIPLIYYGESGGFANNVFVNVKGEPPQIPADNYSWAPDYVLSGGQRALWFFVSGPSTWGFAFTPPQDTMPMLFNRDVFSRVGSTLINGLVVDPETYLVTNGKNLFYDMMVYIDYPIQTGFAQSDFMRNFANVLVNVNDGSMSAYIVDNSSDFLSSFFRSYYSGWNSSLPSWLRPQLRYPEQLLGTQQAPGQLDVDFLYHVSDSSTWRSSADFYQRPKTTPIYYILVNEGSNLYYVGLQLANYLVSQGLNLGGVYLAYGGTRLGQISLYQVPINSTSTNKLIGPQAALQAAETNSTIKSKLFVLGNPTYGNVLPYLINSQLYYFIPIYVNTAQSSAVITKLAFISIVDASNGVSALGSTAASAYSNLIAGETGVTPPIVITNQSQPATLATVVNAFKSQGYTVNTPSFVNVNIGNQAGTIVLSNSTVSNVNKTVTSFITQYAQNKTQPIYEWMPSQGNVTYFGVISNENGLVVSDFISVYP